MKALSRISLTLFSVGMLGFSLLGGGDEALGFLIPALGLALIFGVLSWRELYSKISIGLILLFAFVCSVIVPFLVEQRIKEFHRTVNEAEQFIKEEKGRHLEIFTKAHPSPLPR